MADEEAKSPTAKLKSLFIDSLFEDTEQEAKDLEEEIDSLNRRVGELKRQMRELWEGGGLERQSRYKLTAVFIHRGLSQPVASAILPARLLMPLSTTAGTANSGHYYIYQRDLRDEKRWLKCASAGRVDRPLPTLIPDALVPRRQRFARDRSRRRRSVPRDE